MDRQQHFVDQVTRGADDFAEMLDMRCELGRRFLAAEHLVGNRNRLRPRNSYQRNSPFPGRSGNCRNGVASYALVMPGPGGFRYYFRTLFNAAMHFWFCFIVPTVIRSHSGNPQPSKGRTMIFWASIFLN